MYLTIFVRRLSCWSKEQTACGPVLLYSYRGSNVQLVVLKGKASPQTETEKKIAGASDHTKPVILMSTSS